MDGSEVISRLKFISNLRNGDKIDTQGVRVQPNDWTTPIFRFVWGESKQTTLKFLKGIMDDAFALEEFYNRSKYSHEILMSDIIRNDIAASMEGIKNLKLTYATNIKFTCDLSTLIQNTESRLIDTNRPVNGRMLITTPKSTPKNIPKNVPKNVPNNIPFNTDVQNNCEQNSPLECLEEYMTPMSPSFYFPRISSPLKCPEETMKR